MIQCLLADGRARLRCFSVWRLHALPVSAWVLSASSSISRSPETCIWGGGQLALTLGEKESVNTSSISMLVLQLSLLQVPASAGSFNLSLSALIVTSWLEGLNAADMCISCCWSVACGLIMQPDAAIMPPLRSVVMQAVDKWMLVYPAASMHEGKQDFEPGTIVVEVDLMLS